MRGEIDGITDIPLSELRPRRGVLVACIVRKNEIILPSGDDVIRQGDTVIVVTTERKMHSIKDIV